MIHRKDINVRDPFIFYENGMYYLYVSRHFEGDKYPSFICYSSSDLEYFNEPKILFKGHDGFWATKQYWAPEMHKYKDKYYLFVSLKSDDKCRGTQLFVCDTPDGTFVPLTETPITPKDWECLDGTLYIENDIPYMVFCHEWLQIDDGEIHAMRLSDDLKEAIGEPILLFKASSLKWVKALDDPFYNTNENSLITDGPFLFKRNGKLHMIWSTFGPKGYATALSTADSLLGKWEHNDIPLFEEDGGHGMVFEKDGRKKLTIHVPNDPSGAERLEIFDLEDLIKERGM